jgi:hypothetical protein
MHDQIIDEIASNLIPGKPLLVMGPHGTGKLERVTHAIAKLEQVKYTCHQSIQHGLMCYDYNKWADTVPPYGVMVFDSLRNPHPNFMVFILTQMRDPNRIVVLTDVRCPIILAGRCSKIIEVSTEKHLKSYYESIGYAPHLHG